ncbi:hypothetical protein PV08_10580 [Exophiala spinifera]|uniref:DH domain-containing protein n=1 Tax=Exophiala spinifera TaxID=91928 RepID=A0A0D2AXV6_9EURO|nr:uncharacterized protein PV08_10580 [Exophiala spinifera]KIW11280.1 hypothetical protein PV08_10580 [Exophiala spinifera]
MRPAVPAKASHKVYSTQRTEVLGSPQSPNVASDRAFNNHDHGSVQDRIRQWQAQGAASAVDPDALSVRSTPRSECASFDSRPKSDYGDLDTPRLGRMKEKTEEQPRTERSSSAPRKRIISDGHWRAKRDAKDSKNPRVTARGRVETKRYDLSYTSNQEQQNGQPRPHRKYSFEKSPDLHQNSPANDGIRVIPNPSAQLNTSNQGSLAVPDAASYNQDESPRGLGIQPRLSRQFDATSDISADVNESRQRDRPQSKYVATLGRAPVAPSEGLRSKKAGLLGKTRDMFSKSDSTIPVSNRIPSIEAWLDEQPDPFMDEAPTDELPPVEMPAPLRRRTRKKKSSLDNTKVPDPNHIWDSVQSPDAPLSSEPRSTLEPENDRPRHSPRSDQDSTPKRRRRQIREKDDPDGSPTSLRRAGARVRRRRDTPDKRSISSFEGTKASQPENERLSDSQQILSAAESVGQAALFTKQHELPPLPPEEPDADDGPIPPQLATSSNPESRLKRRLTTHEDLMSVLSMPRARRSRRSARRARSKRMAEESASAHQILASLVSDEQRYSRELRTLVDGVIPVLLQSVLSKTDAAVAAGLFSSALNSQHDMSYTKPIIDMGIALERLKSLHGRIPLQTVESFLSWAQTAQKAYREYLQAWRLGFQDVVVNLAPLDNAPMDQDLTRDEVGDLVDNEGKKVDVAYLLKRPLLRVKALSRALVQIRDQSDRPLAAQVADSFTDLTAFARRRHQEEQARLEDEAAANIDATRTRDIRTMAPTANIAVDKTRRVKARDFFNLTLYHSSGQRMDCGIELIYRDNARGDAPGGDVLICEVDDTGKWLLFPPVQWGSISARRGEDEFDLVIMIRGRAGLGKEWQELLALKTDDKEAVTEWMSMLGSNPLPPRLNRAPSFAKRHQPPKDLSVHQALSEISSGSRTETQSISQGSEPSNVEVPIGEPSVSGARTEASRHVNTERITSERPSLRLNLGGGLASKPRPVQYQTQAPLASRHSVPSMLSSDRSTISDKSIKTVETASFHGPITTKADYVPEPSQVTRMADPLIPVRLPNDALRSPSQKDGIRESQAAERHEGRIYDSPFPGTNQVPRDLKQSLSSPVKNSSSNSPSRDTTPIVTAQGMQPQRPVYARAPSSTPSKDLPSVPRLRPQSQADIGPAGSPLTEPLKTGQFLPENKPKRGPMQDKSTTRSQIFTEDVPVPPPTAQVREGRPSPTIKSPALSPSPSATPRTMDKPQSQLRENHPPELKTTPASSEKAPRRRTSSPLKHEYAPSTSSDSSSDYDTESVSDSSETSEDFSTEQQDKATPLISINPTERRPSKQTYPPSSMPLAIRSHPPSSMQSTGTRTLAPSDSASQGPYRRVPSSNVVPADKKKRAAALICSWSDKGAWEMIHPDECSIVITPGLIEAFEMSAEHSNPGVSSLDKSLPGTTTPTQQPLVGFELTPLVMLRKGAALDIQIRSPPTPNSRIRTSSNIMFRSSNLQACEALYSMINWARCNNPTYIELERARPHQPSVTFNVNSSDQTRSRASSWFSFGSAKKSSYRASSAPTPASIDVSVESSGTMASAFSALRRFSAKPAFNINRSSVVRRDTGTTGPSLYSSSSGTRTGTGSGSSTPAPSQVGFVPGKDGPNVPATSADAANGGGMVNNMKIRLYMRKGQHWENMGGARLSVLPAPASVPAAEQDSSRSVSVAPSPPATPAHAHSRSPSTVEPGSARRGPRLPSSNHTPHRVHGNGREKRVLIVRNKAPDVVLLDAVLGESCFERIMQTGIAVKVWKEDEVIGHTGGVMMGRETVYMLQFASNKEAGWVFGLCGSYRYGFTGE